MSKVIGLTGGIATGKSTVSNMFKARGIPVLDADQIAHDLLERGTKVFQQIVDEFGEDVVSSTGCICRKTLGRIVFDDASKRERLNNIVHPEVKRIMCQQIDAFKSSFEPVIVLDVPLLFESGFHTLCDYTVVVYTDEETQLKRLMKRNNLTQEEAMKRINAQMPLKDKVQLADWVIDNSSHLLETEKQVVALIDKLWN